MMIRIRLICQVLLLASVVQTGIAEDLAKEAEAAKERLRQKQLAKSKKFLDHMITQKDWSSSGSSIRAMFGMTYDDQLVEPLIALTDGDVKSPHQRMVWHAIGVTQTDAAARFLTQRRKAGSADERALADACQAALELRKRGVQCNFKEGFISQLFFPHRDRQLTREDLSLVTRLPAVASVSISNPADGAMEPLRKVTTLEFVGLGCKTAYIDEAIACLGNSKKLSVLNVGGPVTDEAMPELGKFSSLTCLRLNGSKVTDKGLRHLQPLKNLSILELNDTGVTDEGLRHLRGLHNLTYLFLAGTKVTGSGFSHLQEMHKLWAFNLERTQIDDRALGNFREFAALQNVNFLYLGNTNISDAGLKHLATLKKVKGISLGGNERITSLGMSHLNSLANLHWVTCVGGRVSHKAAEQFASGRPTSFYISYTTAPSRPIRHEKGQPLKTDDSPHSKLIKKLRRPGGDGRVTQAVIDELAAQGPKIIDPLLAAVKKQHGVGYAAARVFHKLGPEALETLVEVLREDSDYGLQTTVSRTFAMHGAPVFPRLRKMLSDEDERLRLVASDVIYDFLSQSGARIPDGLYPELFDAVTDKNATVRRNVLSSLFHFLDKIDEMAPVLTKLANSDTDVTTRMRAASTLGYGAAKLDSGDPTLRQAVETLSRLADKDTSFYVREVSIYHLEKLAAKDKRVVRALVRATGDERESTRAKAAQALKKLGYEINGEKK